MSDIIKKLEEWLVKEPNQTEVIIIRHTNGTFSTKIEYGDRTTSAVGESQSLKEALSVSAESANRVRSAARKIAEKKQFVLPGSEPEKQTRSRKNRSCYPVRLIFKPIPEYQKRSATGEAVGLKVIIRKPFCSTT